MPLSRAAIDELNILYIETYGEPSGEEEARDLGHRLLRLFDLATRRLPPDFPAR